MHNLCRTKNWEPSSGSPSENPFLTLTAARSALPVSDVPRAVTRTSAMNPLQVYCAQGHFWPSLAKAFRVSTSDTLSHAQLARNARGHSGWECHSYFPFFIFPGKRDKNVTCWDMSDLHLHPQPVDEGEKKGHSAHLESLSAQSRHLQMSPSVTLFIRAAR